MVTSQPSRSRPEKRYARLHFAGGNGATEASRFAAAGSRETLRVLVLLCLLRVVPTMTKPDPLNQAVQEGAVTAAMTYSEGPVTYQTAVNKQRHRDGCVWRHHRL
jgi:hypothetical protein